MLVRVSTVTFFMFAHTFFQVLQTMDGLTGLRGHTTIGLKTLFHFAVIVIVAHLENIYNEAIESAAMAYFWLRVIHYLFYTFRIFYIRTPAFIGSWLAQICIVYRILINLYDGH
jgi:uncharacterized MAPEG superfamily protein